jgi:putative membrane protein
MWWGDHMGSWGWGGGWGGGGWFWAMHLLWWVLAVVLVVLIFRFVSGGMRDRNRGGGDTALTILRERFARGEIDQREFDERKAILKK